MDQWGPQGFRDWEQLLYKKQNTKTPRGIVISETDYDYYYQFLLTVASDLYMGKNTRNNNSPSH